MSLPTNTFELYPSEAYRSIHTINGSPRKYCPICRQWLALSFFPIVSFSVSPICLTCLPSIPPAPPLKKQPKTFKPVQHRYSSLAKPKKRDNPIYTYRPLDDIITFRSRLVKYQGSCCIITGKKPCDAHHILPYTSKDNIYEKYRTDPLNGVMLFKLLHEFVTFHGSKHYVQFFFDLLDQRFKVSHRSYPIPPVEQRNLIQDIQGIDLSAYWSNRGH